MLPSEPGDVFYKTATAQARSGNGVKGESAPVGDGEGGTAAGAAGDAVDPGGVDGRGEGDRPPDGGRRAAAFS